MSDSTRQRLRDLIALLRTRSDGMTTPEIGEHFGVTRQTAYNDINRLESQGVAVWNEGDLYGIDNNNFHQIILTPSQAWFMYLPLRRFVRAQMHRLPVVKSLLHQVATLFDAEVADQLMPEAGDEDAPANKQFIDLVDAWRRQRYVEIKYRRLNSSSASTLTVAPWWFEPAVWTDSFYLIGSLKPHANTNRPTEMITLKLNRISDIKLLADQFERPEGADVLRSLEQTWGIWVSEDDAVTVKLRFHNRQLDRLRETRWHPTQKLTVEHDGSVLWEAVIAEPQEMLPWVRSWGADVEVLEPNKMRQQIAAEAAATARLYGSVNQHDESRLY